MNTSALQMRRQGTNAAGPGALTSWRSLAGGHRSIGVGNRSKERPSSKQKARNCFARFYTARGSATNYECFIFNTNSRLLVSLRFATTTSVLAATTKKHSASGHLQRSFRKAGSFEFQPGSSFVDLLEVVLGQFDLGTIR